MSLIQVILLGSTGETGSAILEGLIEDGHYDITLFVRQASLKSEGVSKLKSRGLHVVTASPEASVEDLARLLIDASIDVVISAVGPTAQLDQLKWIDAAHKANIRRFVPCGFTTIAPRGDIMLIRDEKEVVHDHIFRHHLPYTIIDVGYWYALSLFPVPSGKLDYLIEFRSTEVFGDGAAPNLITDKPDIGRFVARIVRDPRTLNTRVVAHGDELSQNQIIAIEERLSGEKLNTIHVTAEVVGKRKAEAIANRGDSTGFSTLVPVVLQQYVNSKYLRRDNTLENAKYLGYLDARELYPDFVPKTFEAYVGEALQGGCLKPYASMSLSPGTKT